MLGGREVWLYKTGAPGRVLGSEALSDPRVLKVRAGIGQRPEACVGEGVPQDYAEAVTWYRKAAEQGHSIAQYRLGFMYFEGQGVPRDHVEAAKWLRKAADQGLAVAQYTLGIMYVEGEGVPQDYAQALRWLRKAAEQGNADAQYNLGVTYGEGRGVPQDYIRAYIWLSLAAAQGHENAVKSRDTLARHMTAAQMSEAQNLAREWTPTITPPR